MSSPSAPSILAMTHRRKGVRYWEGGTWHPIGELVGRRVLCARKGRVVWNPPVVGTVRAIVATGAYEVRWDGTTFDDQMDGVDLVLLPENPPLGPTEVRLECGHVRVCPTRLDAQDERVTHATCRVKGCDWHRERYGAPLKVALLIVERPR
jgi:hypothetical protein